MHIMRSNEEGFSTPQRAFDKSASSGSVRNIVRFVFRIQEVGPDAVAPLPVAASWPGMPVYLFSSTIKPAAVFEIGMW